MGSSLAQTGEQVTEAAANGGFERAESHVSRLPLTLDDQGFEDAARELAVMATRLAEIEAASSERMAAGGGSGEPALAVLMLAQAG